MNIVKSAKIIGIGEEGIKTLKTIEDKVKNNMDIEEIQINQDVDKDYVRNLLDGIEVLYLAYSTENQRAKDIAKAISYMASERRVLCIGINSSLKENKDDLGLDREFTISENNFDKTIHLINMMIEAISDDCMISIDLSDLKEALCADKGIKYSYEEFTKDNSAEEVAKKLIDNVEQIGTELSGKKGILFVDLDENHCDSSNMMIALNTILTNVQETLDDTYEIIFSLYVKNQTEGNARIGLIYN